MRKRAAVAATTVGLAVSAEETFAKPDSRSASATSYCLSGRMADGTFTRKRSAAHNGLRLGTKIKLIGKAGPNGIRKFVIRDRIGWGTELDLWTGSCATARRWGRHYLRFKIGWR